jgi:tetratricopeptide (TPR) repeat protein
MVDEYYIRGLKAFNRKDYPGAIADWCQVLEFDTLNVRAAILLQIAMNFRNEQIEFAGEGVARKDPPLVRAREALAAHRRQVLKQRLKEKEEKLTSQEIATHQIKAIDYYTEGRFADAIREWDEVLKIDPSNARALLFREMAIGQLKKAGQE